MPTKEVFISKKTLPANGLDVKTLLCKKPTPGEVGLEIEIEGKKLPGVNGTIAPVPPPWAYTEDHSLRGEENGEYVLKKPIPFDKVGPALKILWECFGKNKSKIDDSNRTSVHVHVNVQDWYLNRLCAFIALYYIVEIPLTEWCGEHRVGNLFCLRAIDAPAQVSNMRNFIKSNGETKLPETLHYAALNVNALQKYGSLEIRTLRGCSNPTVILDWVEVIQRLYELSADFTDPRTICTSLSSVGPLAFFDNILGPKANVVRSACGMNDNEIAESVYEGVRIAQDLAYCKDWALYKPMKLKTDPFNRSLKNVAKKLQQQQGFDDPWSQMISVNNGSYTIPGTAAPNHGEYGPPISASMSEEQLEQYLNEGELPQWDT